MLRFVHSTIVHDNEWLKSAHPPWRSTELGSEYNTVQILVSIQCFVFKVKHFEICYVRMDAFLIRQDVNLNLSEIFKEVSLKEG